MKNSRLKTLLIGLIAGVAYAFLCMLIVTHFHKNVSVGYIFLLPVILGAIPVLFSTKEQLKTYKSYLLLPWLITFTFFVLCFVTGFEGMICLVIIVAPFVLLGTLGAFITRMVKLKEKGEGTKLYASLLLPLLVFAFESDFRATDQVHTVSTSIVINADRNNVWEHIKNVRNIQSSEIKTHFIHLIGIPKPLNGELDKEGVGGTRHITWEKSIRFEEKITQWNEGKGFSYDIHVDPASIPPTTLDEHVMIGGKYFDVLKGSYTIEPIDAAKNKVTLTCTYRVTTNLNLYSKLWADFILDDFNNMILEVIKKRSEIK
ncbi:SRPBCC family protein [Ferruginibacter sp.]